MMSIGFLGPEFLTWLCFEQDSELVLGKRISLKPLQGDEHKVIVTCPNLDNSGEFLQAIRSGYYVDSVALEWAQNDKDHSFTLTASDGSISGVKTEGAEKTTGDSEEADIMLRMSQLDAIEELISKLFNKFLELRLGQTFVSREIKAIRESVIEGLRNRLPVSTQNPPRPFSGDLAEIQA